jgi:hypothetical protein
MGGLGVEVLQKRTFAIDLQAKFNLSNIKGGHYNYLVGIGFNFY